MDLSKTLLINMSVNLSRRDVGVAQKLLNHSQVGPILQKVSRKGMAQKMGVDFLGESGLARSIPDDLSDAVGAQRAAADREKNFGGASCLYQCGAFILQVVLKCFSGLAADWNNTGFVALSGHPEKAIIKVEGFQPDGADFSEAEAG